MGSAQRLSGNLEQSEASKLIRNDLFCLYVRTASSPRGGRGPQACGRGIAGSESRRLRLQTQVPAPVHPADGGHFLPGVCLAPPGRAFWREDLRINARAAVPRVFSARPAGSARIAPAILRRSLSLRIPLPHTSPLPLGVLPPFAYPGASTPPQVHLVLVNLSIWITILGEFIPMAIAFPFIWLSSQVGRLPWPRRCSSGGCPFGAPTRHSISCPYLPPPYSPAPPPSLRSVPIPCPSRSWGRCATPLSTPPAPAWPRASCGWRASTSRPSASRCPGGLGGRARHRSAPAGPQPGPLPPILSSHPPAEQFSLRRPPVRPAELLEGPGG